MSNTFARIVIVEDHVLLAQSLQLALTAEGFDAVAVPVHADARHASALLQPVAELHPALVLLDLDLGDAGDALPLVGALASAGAAVVVVTGCTDRTRWGECLAAGARTVMGKSSPLEIIVGTVRRTLAGEQVMSETQRAELIQRWYQHRRDAQSSRAPLDRLTPRENEVLAALAEGRRVRDIASASYVSEATVRTQVKSILAKLGVSSQIAAVALVRHLDWDLAS